MALRSAEPLNESGLSDARWRRELKLRRARRVGAGEEHLATGIIGTRACPRGHLQERLGVGGHVRHGGAGQSGFEPDAIRVPESAKDLLTHPAERLEPLDVPGADEGSVGTGG